MTKVIKRKTQDQLEHEIADLLNEKAKIHNLRAHIRFTLGKMCFESTCPILANEYSHRCAIVRKKIKLYNEIPYEIWERGKCIKRYEVGTWREFIDKRVDKADIEAFIPVLFKNLIANLCPYTLDIETWSQLRWLCYTYEVGAEDFKDAVIAKAWYALNVKEMYKVLNYSPNTCW